MGEHHHPYERILSGPQNWRRPTAHEPHFFQRCLQPETWPNQDSFSPYLGFNSLFLYVSFYVTPDWLSSVTGDGHLSSQTYSFNSFRLQIGSSCVSSSVWKTLGSDSDWPDLGLVPTPLSATGWTWITCPSLRSTLWRVRRLGEGGSAKIGSVH